MTESLKQRLPSLEEMTQAARAQLVLSAADRRNLLIGAGIFVAAASVPLIFGGYLLQLAISIVMYAALATSWLLFSGPTNYIALSTAAFFGIGMYTVAGGIDLFPYPLLIIAAGVIGAALAVVVGLATLRVSGVYFVIFSLGLAELVRQIMTWLQHVLGTLSGLYVTIDRSETEYYWQLLLLTAVVFLVGWWIGRSRLGFALRIIGNDEVVAVHCGVNTAIAKVILFVISSAFASIAGALVAPRWSYVEPVVAFSPFVSFQVVIMALLGGTHRLWGPLLGVVPFVLLWELISIEFPNQTTLLLGVCFLLIVYVIPNGLTGIVEDVMAGRIGLRTLLDNASKYARAVINDPQANLGEPLRLALDRGGKAVVASSAELADTVHTAFNRGLKVRVVRSAQLADTIHAGLSRGLKVTVVRSAEFADTIHAGFSRGLKVTVVRSAELGGTARDTIRNVIERWGSRNA